MGYFLLPPDHIDGNGTNYHVYSGEKTLETKCTMVQKSDCIFKLDRNDKASCSDMYFETKSELVAFFNKNTTKVICAKCSEMHKHADS